MEDIISNVFGNLIRVKKSRYFSGKSNITNKFLYKIQYTAYFHKANVHRLGFIDGLEYSFSHTEYRKSDIEKFLKKNGYLEFTITQ